MFSFDKNIKLYHYSIYSFIQFYVMLIYFFYLLSKIYEIFRN